jgi:hypothetical protein
MPGAYRTADSTAPARRAAAVTLSDSTVLENTRGVYVGGAGDLKVSMVEGGDVTFSAVPAGTVLPIQITKAWSTGSTATLVLALY